MVCAIINHEILESPINVYNFEVEDFHTYFVGENSVLVHNSCGNKKTLESQEGGAYKNVSANGGQVHHMLANSVSPLKETGLELEWIQLIIRIIQVNYLHDTE